jgi:hypothetical protein
MLAVADLAQKSLIEHASSPFGKMKVAPCHKQQIQLVMYPEVPKVTTTPLNPFTASPAAMQPGIDLGKTF